MINIPVLYCKKSFVGSTDYIDRIHKNELSYSIMIGIDYFNRVFIVFSTTIQNRNKVEVLFQRYSNCKNTWSNSGFGIVCESGHFMINGHMKHQLLPVNIYNLIHNIGLYIIIRFVLIKLKFEKIFIYHYDI